jgi:hypothetical protein
MRRRVVSEVSKDHFVVVSAVKQSSSLKALWKVRSCSSMEETSRSETLDYKFGELQDFDKY